MRWVTKGETTRHKPFSQCLNSTKVIHTAGKWATDGNMK